MSELVTENQCAQRIKIVPETRFYLLQWLWVQDELTGFRSGQSICDMGMWIDFEVVVIIQCKSMIDHKKLILILQRFPDYHIE